MQGADLEVVAGRPRAQHVGQLERDVLQAVRQDLLRQVGEERPLAGIKLKNLEYWRLREYAQKVKPQNGQISGSNLHWAETSKFAAAAT